MLDALKKYGMIVADNGSNWFISGAADTRWNDDDLEPAQDGARAARSRSSTRASRCTSSAHPHLQSTGALLHPSRPGAGRSGPGVGVGLPPSAARSSRCPLGSSVVLGGVTIADTTRGFRVLETSHPPNYYFPPDDVAPGALTPGDGGSFCEWKGRAHYFTVRGGERVEDDGRVGATPHRARRSPPSPTTSRSTPAAWTRASSTTSSSSPNPVASTAAGSRRPSSARSRAVPAPAAGSTRRSDEHLDSRPPACVRATARDVRTRAGAGAT